MRLLSVPWAAVARHRYRRRCEDDAEAYARQPLTEAEMAVGDDPGTGPPPHPGDPAASAEQEYGFMGTLVDVKTTLELPDDLLREVKLRAVQEDRRMKDVVAEALRLYLDRREGAAGVRHRVELPLVLCEAADPADEVTPERAASLLVAEEAAGAPPP